MKYHIITYGCQMNKSDSEKIAAQLEEKGYQPVQKTEEADLVVINVCSVRQSAVNRVYSKVNQIHSQSVEQQKKTKIILTGCILEKDKKQLVSQVDEIWPIIDLEAKPKCQSSWHAFIPIMTGCNNFCSYCVVPGTRGREYSRPAQKIIEEVKSLVKKEYKEITLLGQNVNSYQSQGRSFLKRTVLDPLNFPKLLKLINDIPGNFQIKFLTSHPKDMSDELIEVIAQGKKITKEIHLPVQSGDDEILKKMNRQYTINHYKNLIKKIQRAIPQVKISTDIIVGFPSETKKQFQNTVKLIKEIKFSRAYISAYSPRAGTTAAKLKDNVPSGEKKRRKRILLEMFK
jgi:tRNA-2-methylthio-N6-dimethylallyladenosine synthase